jgi:hypothetical protein
MVDIYKYITLLCTKRTFWSEKINTKMSFYASKVAGGRKYCKYEGLCNSLIINNKTFEGQKWGCN